MTDKELLYAQDVLGHLQHFLQLCAEAQATCANCEIHGFATELSSVANNAISDLNSLLKRYGG